MFLLFTSSFDRRTFRSEKLLDRDRTSARIKTGLAAILILFLLPFLPLLPCLRPQSSRYDSTSDKTQAISLNEEHGTTGKSWKKRSVLHASHRNASPSAHRIARPNRIRIPFSMHIGGSRSDFHGARSEVTSVRHLSVENGERRDCRNFC